MEQIVGTRPGPAGRRSLEEIIDDIVAALGDTSLDDLVMSEDETRAVLLREIPLFVALLGTEETDLEEAFAAKLDRARELDGLLGTLAAKLNEPGCVPSAELLFCPPGGVHRGMSREQIARALDHKPAQREFMQRLVMMRRICQTVAQQLQLDRRQKRGPPQDRAKNWAARRAIYLMLTKTRLLPTGSQHGAYRDIASLLYEALTGEQGVDLKRACDRELRRHRGGYALKP